MGVLTSTKVLLIGVGNRTRGDDAAGPAVADLVRATEIPHVRVLEHSGEGASLMETWRCDDVVYLVDAAHSGADPGFIHIFDAHADAIPFEFLRYSSHAFSVAEAIELARVLGRLPLRLTLIAIEGKAFDAGKSLSPAVAKAISTVARILEMEIRELPNSAAGVATCTNSA